MKTATTTPKPLLSKEGKKGEVEKLIMTRIFNKKTELIKRRLLRNNMPLSEVILWSRLKNKQLGGYKFRRQYSVGRYVVDFYCPTLKLAIEIDGDSHFIDSMKEYDKVRQNFIESFGVKFLRFTNLDIINNLNSSLEQIVKKGFTTPKPLLSKEGKKGEVK